MDDSAEQIVPWLLHLTHCPFVCWVSMSTGSCFSSSKFRRGGTDALFQAPSTCGPTSFSFVPRGNGEAVMMAFKWCDWYSFSGWNNAEECGGVGHLQHCRCPGTPGFPFWLALLPVVCQNRDRNADIPSVRDQTCLSPCI